MAASITDTLSRVTDSTTGRPVIALLANPGKAIAAASININDATNWTTESVIHFSIFETITVAGVTIKDTSTQTDWKGVLAGTTITGLTLTGGTDRAYTAGALVELTPTSRYAKDLYDNITTHANQDGSLKTSAVQAALNIGSTPADYTVLATAPTSVSYLGNRSYSLIYAGVDYTDRLNPGIRLRTTRTVAAPTQCALFDGTNDYYSKSSPVGMTFTDDFTVSAWVKLSAYQAGDITSRFNATNGWRVAINSTGQIEAYGYAGAANFRGFVSVQSLPLNRWVHVTIQIDMSAYTATSTTMYCMIDGVDVPISLTQGGTNPTALVQAGNLEVGSRNAGNFFNGKIAQVAIYSAKVTQATIRDSISQGLLGSETSLISAYSFSNAITDLKTATANDLTANGGVLATNADSPFGTQASGSISSTLDYAIIMAAVFSTNTTVTVQVPEGCTIPVSGGITSSAYSSARAPYGFPADRGKWRLVFVKKLAGIQSSPVASTYYNLDSYKANIPIGAWIVGRSGRVWGNISGTSMIAAVTLSTSSSAETYDQLTSHAVGQGATGSMVAHNDDTKSTPITLSAATDFYMLHRSLTASAAGIRDLADGSPSVIFAENAYL